ncbi:MAG: DUF3999 family protein [Rhodocyclaceae bacterium]
MTSISLLRSRRKLAVVALCALPAVTNAASTLQPADFATGRVLQLEGNQPFYRITLPIELYTGTAYPDLRDLRIFNGKGEALPHAFVRPAMGKEAARSVVLQSFRLSANASTSETPAIELQAPGLRLHVERTGGKGIAAEYLLTTQSANAAKDASPPAISSLHLDWETGGSWQQRVQVEGSHDLKHWSSVAQAQPLMDLQNGAQRFVQSDVPFDYPQEYRYWRLRFDQGDAPTLRTVSAQLATERTPAPPVSVAATQINSGKDGESSAYYQLPAAVRFNALRILPQQPNSVLPMRIETRAGDKSNWQAWANTVAYRLASPQGERQSGATQGPEVVARELRLVAAGPGWGGLAPTVQAERDAIEVIFNARGSGPWLLAWGSRAADDASLPLDTLQTGIKAEAIDNIPLAGIGAEEALGGAERLTALAPAERQQRWRTVLVWVALVAGAAALVRLAFSIWKQTRSV